MHIASSETAPIITEVKGYGLRSRPVKTEPATSEPTMDNIKTDQLLDQAHALIDKAKRFVTKPVHSKHLRKRPSSTQNDEPKALDVLHDMTVNKLSTLHVETDGTT